MRKKGTGKKREKKAEGIRDRGRRLEYTKGVGKEKNERKLQLMIERRMGREEQGKRKRNKEQGKREEGKKGRQEDGKKSGRKEGGKG